MRIKIYANKAGVSQAGALLKKAMLLYEQRKISEAEKLFLSVLKSLPNNPIALYSYGLLLINSGRTQEGLDVVVHGTDTNPGFLLLWFLRGGMHKEFYQLESALDSYDKALDLDPKHIPSLVNSGAILRQLLRHSEAHQRFERILEIDPNDLQALSNYGALLSESYKERIPDSILVFSHLLKIKPDYPYARGILAFNKMHISDWSTVELDTVEITQSIRAGQRATRALGYMSLSDSAEDQFKCTRILVKDEFSFKKTPLWNGQKYSHARIKIAYVSADFREHPVGHLIAGVIENHDRKKFEIICVSIGIDDESKLRKRIINGSDHFILGQQLSSLDIANLLRKMEVDILVDLNGHTADSRTDIFMYKPAPVQVNYLGYPGTMALDCFDYIIADRTIIPTEHQEFYSEKVAYLDYCYLPIPCGVEASTPLARSEYGLPENGIVFCAFSHTFKTHPKIFSVWMRLLQSHPGSVIWLMSLDKISQENLRAQARLASIEPERLIFANRIPRVEDHLARYRVADIFLDTWPYNAHTTAADALLVGLPVVTYKGQSFPSRVAASLLESLGLHELVADSAEGYFEVAQALASDPNRLAVVKSKLTTDKVRNHPVFGASFTRRLESVFQSIALCELEVRDTESRPFTSHRIASENRTDDPRTKNAHIDLLRELCKKGNYPQAEIMLRDYSSENAASDQLDDIWQRICTGYGLQTNFRLSENLFDHTSNKRYLFIKSWGYDFWSDVHHLASQILVAELTGRIPIIWWGKNFIYEDGGGVENFSKYFLPINNVSLDDFPDHVDIYPPKWDWKNIKQENFNKWSGPFSRFAAQYIFSRNESVVVSDFYATLHSIIPWIDSSSVYYGKSEDDLYGDIFRSYFKFNNRVLSKANDFFDLSMKGKNWVAVHVPTVAKVEGVESGNKNCDMVFPYLDLVLKKNPQMGVFLLADSLEILQLFNARYGDLILSPTGLNSAPLTTLDQKSISGQQSGYELVMASYLATKCDIFLGNKESNTSLAIFSLKNWAPGCFHLVGQANIRSKNYILHNWT